MNREYYISTKDMTVGYHSVPLIKNIELNVKPGEILTLIGPNGSGKSTILKSITKQLSLISGTVYLDRQSMQSMTEQEISRKMSVVMTERIHAELMTCEDVVSTGRYPYTGRLGILTAYDKEKVREAMEMVHALELADRDFSAISDGQKQRVLLARAICQEPEIIVLDEPTSFLGSGPKVVRYDKNPSLSTSSSRESLCNPRYTILRQTHFQGKRRLHTLFLGFCRHKSIYCHRRYDKYIPHQYHREPQHHIRQHIPY